MIIGLNWIGDLLRHAESSHLPTLKYKLEAAYKRELEAGEKNYIREYRLANELEEKAENIANDILPHSVVGSEWHPDDLEDMEGQVAELKDLVAALEGYIQEKRDELESEPITDEDQHPGVGRASTWVNPNALKGDNRP